MNYADDFRHALNLLEGALEGMALAGASTGALAGAIQAVDELRAAYDELPNDIADAENEHCLGCMYYRRTTDREPYGDRMVARISAECTVPDPVKCPAVNACGFEDPDRPETYLPRWLCRQAE